MHADPLVGRQRVDHRAGQVEEVLDVGGQREAVAHEQGGGGQAGLGGLGQGLEHGRRGGDARQHAAQATHQRLVRAAVPDDDAGAAEGHAGDEAGPAQVVEGDAHVDGAQPVLAGDDLGVDLVAGEVPAGRDVDEHQARRVDGRAGSVGVAGAVRRVGSGGAGSRSRRGLSIGCRSGHGPSVTPTVFRISHSVKKISTDRHEPGRSPGT
ncbi:hypothetical protein [Frigoribacterium endophyticum]|uniref:hypothetical protein n=1 Tax=Frigoribacterium endophyticum TaxID=1522176 RepID=UPI00141F0B37|nr:hypothetical protein [Frigoribacterium endophyticum]NII52250.1 hypothetical protein [Frigoribacterium endophyticum]